jgi:small subunit ribosomal protein S6
MFILRTDAAQEQMDRSVQQIKETITKCGGTVTDQQPWGRRKMAYPIAKQREGFYLLAHFTALPRAIPALEQALRVNETLLRSLIVLQPATTSVPPLQPSEHGEPQ